MTGFKRWIGHIVIAAAALTMGLLFAPMTAKAEVYTSMNYVTFDHVKYADTYKDLKDAMGYNKDLLYWHWVNNGSKENRTACISRYSYLNPANFDYDAYRENYPELARKYGADELALWNHYVTTGEKEGRLCRSTDPYVDAIVRTMDVAASIAKSTKDEGERVKLAHDFLVRNCGFDYKRYMLDTVPDASYNPRGLWEDHYMVGQGYAETMDIMLRFMGIPTRIITGEGYYNTGWSRHAWNQVKIGGKWYYLDVAWDDPHPDGGTKGDIIYTYYLLDKETMYKSHREK